MELDGRASEGRLTEVISHLMTALEAAKRAPNQDMLVRLIEAVLLHAGRELVRETKVPNPDASNDV